MHSAFAANPRKSRSSEWRSQIAQEPAVHPCDAHTHLLRYAMATLQIAGPISKPPVRTCIVRQGNSFFFRIKRRNVAHRPKNFFLPHTEPIPAVQY